MLRVSGGRTDVWCQIRAHPILFSRFWILPSHIFTECFCHTFKWSSVDTYEKWIFSLIKVVKDLTDEVRYRIIQKRNFSELKKKTKRKDKNK